MIAPLSLLLKEHTRVPVEYFSINPSCLLCIFFLVLYIRSFVFSLALLSWARSLFKTVYEFYKLLCKITYPWHIEIDLCITNIYLQFIYLLFIYLDKEWTKWSFDFNIKEKTATSSGGILLASVEQQAVWVFYKHVACY